MKPFSNGIDQSRPKTQLRQYDVKWRAVTSQIVRDDEKRGYKQADWQDALDNVRPIDQKSNFMAYQAGGQYSERKMN